MDFASVGQPALQLFSAQLQPALYYCSGRSDPFKKTLYSPFADPSTVANPPPRHSGWPRTIPHERLWQYVLGGLEAPGAPWNRLEAPGNPPTCMDEAE